MSAFIQNYSFLIFIALLVLIGGSAAIAWLLLRKEKGPADVWVDYHARSETGGRSNNQDSCLCVEATLDGRYLFVLADGLGGHLGGEAASTLTVQSIAGSLGQASLENPQEALFDAFQDAHVSVREQGENDYALQGMKSTCVCLILLEDKAVWASVGDSRMYLFRDGRVELLTKDHSVVQVLVESGEITREQAASHPDRHRLYQALGMEGDIVPDINAKGFQLRPGDHFLLCSDGFWEYLDADKALEAFGEVSMGMRAETKLNRLFEMTYARARSENPKHDNITAQLVVIR